MWHGTQQDVHTLRFSQRTHNAHIYTNAGKYIKKHDIKNGNGLREQIYKVTPHYNKQNGGKKRKIRFDGIRVRMRTSCCTILNTPSTGICINLIPFAVHMRVKKNKAENEKQLDLCIFILSSFDS